jgi:hypothetical protein
MACIYTPYDPASVYPVINPNSLMTELPHRYGYGFHQDGIMITVEDDPSLTRCQIRVILTTPPIVTWRKELHAWNFMNNNSAAFIATEDIDHGPREMVITIGKCHSGTDTILFKKIAWNRIMYSMYTLNSYELWTYWGGKKVTFDWEIDNRGSGIWGEQTTIPAPQVYPNGTLLTGDNVMIYQIQGMAKFEHLNRFSPPDLDPWPPTPRPPQGDPPQLFNPIQVDKSFMERVREQAMDGTLLRESNRPEVYVMFGGAKFHIPDAATAARMGFNLNNVGVVRPGSIKVNDSENIPRHGTVLREETDPRVYVMRNGQKCHIASPTRMDQLCILGSDVRFVPDGGLRHIPDGPLA